MPNLLSNAGNMLSNAGRYIAHNPGSVAGIGAGLGAAAGVGREALREGEQPKNYLRAGLRGAAVGGLAGGALSGVGHAAHDTMLLHPELKGVGDIAKATAGRMGQGVSNFAQRQFHGLTGYGGKNQAYLDRIGLAGAETSAKKMQLLNLRAESDLGHHLKQVHGLKDPLDRTQGFVEHLQKQRASGDALVAAGGAHAAEGAAAQGIRDLGMSSVPGAVKGLVTNPREASKALWNQARSGGGLALAAGVGLPSVMAANDLRKGDESATGGQTVGQKALRHGTSIGGGLLFGGVPMIPGMIASGVADSAARRAGNLLSPSRAAPQIAPAAM